jgi:dihydrofolate reductase
MNTLAPGEAKSHPIEINGYAIVSDDDRIAGPDGIIPTSLRNEKDWECFQRALAGSDLVVLGHRSHKLAPNVRGDQRLVISRGAAGLEQRANVWWWHPALMSWAEVARELLPRGGDVAVPGGQGVFDLFLKIGLDAFHLTRAHGVRLPGGRALFSGCDTGLSAEAVLAGAGLSVSEKIVLDAEHGVDMSVWRAVRETGTARGENR